MLASIVEFAQAHWLLTAIVVAAVALFLKLLLGGEAPLPRKFTKCPQPPEETFEEEDRAARRRFSASRLAKVVPKDGFDVIVIGSGPSGMCCAASLARLGAKVCVLEQVSTD